MHNDIGRHQNFIVKGKGVQQIPSQYSIIGEKEYEV